MSRLHSWPARRLAGQLRRGTGGLAWLAACAKHQQSGCIPKGFPSLSGGLLT